MIDLICSTLREMFPEAAVHKGQAGGTEGPAFYVAAIESSQEKRIGYLYTQTSKFVIRYHPGADSNGYEGLEEVANALYPAMEHMEQGGPALCGYGMRHRIEENVLQFFLTCKQNLKRKSNEPLMEELETEIRERG